MERNSFGKGVGSEVGDGLHYSHKRLEFGHNYPVLSCDHVIFSIDTSYLDFN
jgi:hypothetical protein